MYTETAPMWWRSGAYIICGVILLACLAAMLFNFSMMVKTAPSQALYLNVTRHHVSAGTLHDDTGFLRNVSIMSVVVNRKPWRDSPIFITVHHGLGHVCDVTRYSELRFATAQPFILAGCGLAGTFFVSRHAQRHHPGHCICGYDLRGNLAATACPECGKAIDRKSTN